MTSQHATYYKIKCDEYEQVRSAVATVQDTAARDRRDLTADELRTVRENVERGKALYTEIEQLNDHETRSAAVGEMQGRIATALRSGGAERLGVGGSPADPYGERSALDATVPPLMPSAEKIAEMLRSQREGDPRPIRVTTVARSTDQHRAVVTLAGDLGAPSSAMGAREPIEPRRIARAANLIVENVDGVEGKAFPVFGAGAAGIAAENVLKPEYDNISPGTATPQMISVWTDFTRQAFATHVGFEARLRQKLAALVAAREDLLLVTKVLGTVGLPTQVATAAPMAAQLLVAAGAVAASSVGQAPDLAVVNPADLGSIFGAGIGSSSPAELAEFNLRLHGMTVYPTTAIAAGTALVGAWRASTRYVSGMRPTWLLDPYTGLKTNKITGLLEEAVDIAVEEPTGFVSVDLVV